MLENNEIENIRKSANIVDIVSSYDIHLIQKGKNYFGICPFHEDTNPSMSVSEEKQIYKCFSCGAAGNVFTFVQEYENVSFLEAVKIVAEKCGLTFRNYHSPKAKVKNNKEEYEIMELALKYYQNNLNTSMGLKAKEYLQERSLDEQVIKDFSLGLALDKNHSLHELLINKNYSIPKLLDLGLVNRNGEYLNDVFNNRIIFPIHDLEGNPIGFTGRIYEKTDQAKYINTKESPIFKKGQILFNYHRAISEIKKKKTIIIVEGNMDAIRMYSSGIKNVVALMGTSLTANQVAIIKATRAKIILMLDNDPPGEDATIQNGEILENAGLTPFVVRLSNEKDPDEYIIKNGAQAIINNIEHPLDFLDFKLKYYKKNKDLTNPTDLTNYIKLVINSIKDIKDELLKEITLKKISDEYNISIDLLTNELKKLSTPKKVKEEPKILEKEPASRYNLACCNILYYMMNDYIYINKFKQTLGYFKIKKYRNIANEIMYFADENKEINMADFISFVAPKDYIYDDVMEIVKSVSHEDLKMTEFVEFIKVASNEAKKDTIKELKEQINNELDEEKKLLLAQKLIEIKKGCVGNE